MDVSYLIPEPEFASADGQGGAVSHVQGVSEGLREHNVSICILGERKIQKYIKNFKVECIPKSDMGYLFNKLIFAYRGWTKAQNDDHDVLLVRKNIGILLLSLLTFNFRLIGGGKNKLYWEVNGLTLTNLKKHMVGWLAYYFILLIHKLVLRNGDGVYVVSESLKEELTSGFLGMQTKKIKVIPNGGPNWIGPNQSAMDDSVKFIYFGVFQPYNDFKLLIKGFKKLNKRYKEEVELHFCGYGKMESIISKASKENNQIHYWGSQKLQSLHEKGLASNRAVGLIPMHDEDSARLGSPIKLFDYLALGMPVITSDITNLNKEFSVNETKLVTKYKNHDVDSLCNVMSLFLEDIEWDKFHSIAKTSVLTNSWNNRMKNLKNFME